MIKKKHKVLKRKNRLKYLFLFPLAYLLFPYNISALTLKKEYQIKPNLKFANQKSLSIDNKTQKIFVGVYDDTCSYVLQFNNSLKLENRIKHKIQNNKITSTSLESVLYAHERVWTAEKQSYEHSKFKLFLYNLYSHIHKYFFLTEPDTLLKKISTHIICYNQNGKRLWEKIFKNRNVGKVVKIPDGVCIFGWRRKYGRRKNAQCIRINLEGRYKVIFDFGGLEFKEKNEVRQVIVGEDMLDIMLKRFANSYIFCIDYSGKILRYSFNILLLDPITTYNKTHVFSISQDTNGRGFTLYKIKKPLSELIEREYYEIINDTTKIRRKNKYINDKFKIGGFVIKDCCIDSSGKVNVTGYIERGFKPDIGFIYRFNKEDLKLVEEYQKEGEAFLEIETLNDSLIVVLSIDRRTAEKRIEIFKYK